MNLIDAAIYLETFFSLSPNKYILYGEWVGGVKSGFIPMKFHQELLTQFFAPSQLTKTRNQLPALKLNVLEQFTG